MGFNGGLAGTLGSSSSYEPAAVFSNANGDNSRQMFMRFRIYDEMPPSPSTTVSIVNTRDVAAQTMVSFLIEVT